jgi:hypothetical protein
MRSVIRIAPAGEGCHWQCVHAEWWNFRRMTRKAANQSSDWVWRLTGEVASGFPLWCTWYKIS